MFLCYSVIKIHRRSSPERVEKVLVRRQSIHSSINIHVSMGSPRVKTRLSICTCRQARTHTHSMKGVSAYMCAHTHTVKGVRTTREIKAVRYGLRLPKNRILVKKQNSDKTGCWVLSSIHRMFGHLSKTTMRQLFQEKKLTLWPRSEA